MRVALAASLIAALASAPARADRGDAPTTRQQRAPRADVDDASDGAPRAAADATAEDRAARAALEAVVTADGAAREAALARALPLAADGVDGVAAFLARDRTAPRADRRRALEAIKAAIPDKSGRFVAPPRRSGKENKVDDELDWLAALLRLDPPPPGLGEVVADVAAIRALAGTADVRAAQHLFDVAFADATMIYRDEIGRYLRKMEPASIPALTRESQARDFDRRRYATYQLERLDRQEPGKALAAATGDEALTVAILDAFRETHHREAVHAVFEHVNAEAPRVRAAARAAWMGYVTGPLPPPAPKKKLVLPGGKTAEKETPLWLTYRELAENELRKASGELLGEELPEKAHVDLEELSRAVFAHHDAGRAAREATQWAAAKAKADGGDLEAAAAMLDRLLAANPERGERDKMAQVYFDLAKTKEAAGAWEAAAAAYSKAHGLDPDGPRATAALAAHHYALGKALEAGGKDGGASYRRAIALRPDYAPAKVAAARVEARPEWMLYGAGGAAAAAALLLVAAMLRRRS